MRTNKINMMVLRMNFNYFYILPTLQSFLLFCSFPWRPTKVFFKVLKPSLTQLLPRAVWSWVRPHSFHFWKGGSGGKTFLFIVCLSVCLSVCHVCRFSVFSKLKIIFETSFFGITFRMHFQNQNYLAHLKSIT